MSLLTKLNIWSERNGSPWLDLLRIFLGVLLIFKALLFLSDITYLANILNENLGVNVDSGINAMTLAHIIAILQLVTGVLILCGMGTRLACVFQIPVVFVAVFFVEIRNPGSALDVLSSIVSLVLLVLFLVRGSGKLSLHYFLFL